MLNLPGYLLTESLTRGPVAMSPATRALTKVKIATVAWGSLPAGIGGDRWRFRASEDGRLGSFEPAQCDELTGTSAAPIRSSELVRRRGTAAALMGIRRYGDAGC
jgi:hypothetical protein